MEQLQPIAICTAMAIRKMGRKRCKKIIRNFVKKKAVQAYPVLVEGNGERVAQAEHTFIPNENGVTITTNP